MKKAIFIVGLGVVSLFALLFFFGRRQNNIIQTFNYGCGCERSDIDHGILIKPKIEKNKLRYFYYHEPGDQQFGASDKEFTPNSGVTTKDGNIWIHIPDETPDFLGKSWPDLTEDSLNKFTPEFVGDCKDGTCISYPADSFDGVLLTPFGSVISGMHIRNEVPVIFNVSEPGSLILMGIAALLIGFVFYATKLRKN